jgi:hypothetical protein
MKIQISDLEMSNIIKDMCKESETFKIFYETEIPKLNIKPIWKYDSSLRAEGSAHVSGEIILKKLPSELRGNYKLFLIAHEIGHLILFDTGYPPIIFPMSNMNCRSEEVKRINRLLNSMIFDFSVNAKLKEYGIKIPFTPYKPPNGNSTLIYLLCYIFRYVLLRRYCLQTDEGDEKVIQECLEKYNDKHLVTVGDKIFEIINSKLVDTEGKIKKDQIKPVFFKIFVNLKKNFPPPYNKFELIVKQDNCDIHIDLTVPLSLNDLQV